MAKILFNADFVPMTYEEATFEALVINDDGKIAFTGNLDRARSLFEGAKEVDMDGKTVMPGFIDPHSHFMMTCQNFANADLTHCRSIPEMQKALREFAEKHHLKAGDVLQGNGYDHNALAEKRHPTCQELDAVSTDFPIVVTHASGHVGSASSLAYRMAGIDADFKDPEGGVIVRGTNGDPAGPWEELSAISLLKEKVIEPREHVDFDAIIDDMQDLYLSNGITTCQEGATMMPYADELFALAQAGRLKLDVVSYPLSGLGSNALTTIEKYSAFDGRNYIGHARIGGMKLVLDGSPQGRTAWMTKPYEVVQDGDDPSYCGYPQVSDEDVTACCQAAIDTGHQLLVHCNGDAAGDQFLRCYKTALSRSGNPSKNELRPVMIHCQTARRDQYEDMAQLGMIPSIFVSHVWYWGDVHLQNFGPERGARVSAVHDALDLGLKFNFHTDTPIVPCKLLHAVWCAVNRITKEGKRLAQNQCIGVFDALKGITINAAYEYFEEGLKGTLECGKLADLAVLDRNPLKVNPREIRDISVVETYKQGNSVWHA